MTPKPLTDVEAVAKAANAHIFSDHPSSSTHGELGAARAILRLLKRRGWRKEPVIPILRTLLTKLRYEADKGKVYTARELYRMISELLERKGK